jgi:hypothetical protein
MTARLKLDGKLKEAYETLSSLAAVAYGDIYLLSNQVLSKNPFTSNYLKNFLTDEDVTVNPFWKVVCKLAKYYIASIYHFSLYLARYVTHIISGTKFNIRPGQNELIVLDTFFLCDRIIESNGFNELYFKGLDRFFEETSKNYVYLPVFYGCNRLNIFHKVLKILKRDRVPVLSEYQLLSVKDLLQLFIFMLAYPWHVLTFTSNLECAELASGIRQAKHEMIETLDKVTFHSYSRYLQGRGIAYLPYKKIKLISWYENQVIDKNLYKGLRTNRDKVPIYGAQLFLYSNMDLNIIADEKEVIFDIIPDQIIVNGPFFVPEPSSLNYVTGPSLRYDDQFRISLQRENRRDILVLLSYHRDDTENVLRMLSESDMSSRRIVVKPHPATPIDEKKNLLRPDWIVSNTSIYELFTRSKVVIGYASGSLLEAASIGIPVIRIKNNLWFDYQLFPEIGRGIIWDDARDARELMSLVEKYENVSDLELQEMDRIGAVYKKMFFCEPTKEKIIEAFDLK